MLDGVEGRQINNFMKDLSSSMQVVLPSAVCVTVGSTPGRTHCSASVLDTLLANMNGDSVKAVGSACASLAAGTPTHPHWQPAAAIEASVAVSNMLLLTAPASAKLSAVTGVLLPHPGDGIRALCSSHETSRCS